MFESTIFTSPTFYQASEGMVNYMSGIQFNKRHKIVRSYKIQIDDNLYRTIRNQCHLEAGAKYGTAQNIGIFLTDIATLLGFKINNPWSQGRICSELIYENVLIPRLGGLGYDKDKIKPHEVEDIILNNLKKLTGHN